MQLLNQNEFETKGFVRLPQILKILPVSRSAWWNGIKSGLYPPGIKLGHRTRVWRFEEIENLMAKLDEGEVSK